MSDNEENSPQSPKRVVLEWKCPKCGAGANQHGAGGAETCESKSYNGPCMGLICDCPDDTAEHHGQCQEDPCPTATCYHCGWGGTLPLPPFDLKRLPSWVRKAWDAGWRPPAGWIPE